jgi:zinc protease
MREHSLSFLLVVSALLPSGAGALPQVPIQVVEVEGIHAYRLPNGLQVLLIPDSSKATVTVNVTYRVGSRMESYGETGMAHLLEHLMFRSTKHRANVGAELSKRGIRFNGTTSVDRTNYFETFPSDAAQLSWALKMEAERMTGANVIKKDLDPEMTVVRNEMELGENNPLNILVQKTVAAAYEWHNNGKSTIGARSDVENVNIAHLQAFYRKYYQPDNATLIVAGAFDAARALQEIVSEFGLIPKPSRSLEATYTLEPVQDGEREVTLRRVGGVQALVVAYHIPAVASADYAGFEVIANALGNTPNGRLHKRLVEVGKAVQAVGWTSRQVEPGLLILGVVVKKDDSLADAQASLLATVEGLADEPITPAEVLRMKLQWEKAFDEILANPERLCVTLSEAIAAGDWRLLFVLRDRVKSVTVDQVNASLRAWIKSSNRTLGRFVPTAEPDRAPVAGFVSAETAVQGFHPGAAVGAGEVFDASPANLDVRTHRVTLPSGLKLALLPKKTRGETVKVQFNLHFGSAEDLRGERVAGSLVAEFLTLGTKTKTRAQLHDAFDALKTEWNIGGNAWVASAKLATTRESLAPALGLLAEILREPAFTTDEFEQLLRQQIGQVEDAATEPFAIAGVRLKHELKPYPESDVRYAPEFPEQIRALKATSRDAAIAFYKRFWGASNAELAIVGDFDEGEVRSLVTQLFGAWVSTGPYVRLPQPASLVFGRHLTSLIKDKPNACAVGVLPLLLEDTDIDYPALLAATHVLGAGGFESRLIKRLRAKDGLSYGAGANLSASNFEASGALAFFAIFAPQNRDRVEQGFAEEIGRFVKDGITADELAATKKAIIDGQRAQRADDAEVAGAWTVWLESNRSYAFQADIEAKVLALTVDQVNATIRKWIDPSHVDWSLAGDFQ